MHEYLTNFDKYNKELPIYVEKPFSEDQISRLREIFNNSMERSVEYRLLSSGRKEYLGEDRLDPKKIVHMSRVMIEFNCPKDIEDTMDSYCKPLYKEEIKLTHYNYIDYNMKHGDGEFAPALPPHIDADENLITFNYMLGGNIEDWDVWIANKPYQLKTGDAIIFSAVNQVHWRPKRKWSEGEFVEIVSFDYCLPTNHRWTGEINPIDPHFFPEERKKYGEDLMKREEFVSAWKIYRQMGLEDGIQLDKNADFK